MNGIVSRIACLAFAATPFVLVVAQNTTPPAVQMAEKVFKDIKVFKGVPASDLIPAMQFMSASMNYKCSDCHEPNDYAAPHKNKDASRKMVIMQREINEKHFNNRLEVTCMSCHNKQEHPNGMPLPEGIKRRHEELDAAPKPQDLISGHLAKLGPITGTLIRNGTLTAPNDETEEIETKPVELLQAPNGKFRLVSGARKVGSDGSQLWYGTYPLADEPAAIFHRIGRAWRSNDDFKGLSRPSVTGGQMVGKDNSVVVQGFRSTTNSAEELYFDSKTKLLVRMVNFRRSTIGTVASVIDYGNFKLIGNVRVPMRVVVTFGDGKKWVMNFATAKIDPSVKPAQFQMPK